MATLVTDLVYLGHNTDANYQATLGAFKAAMLAVNPAILTQAADIYQVNPASATKPANGTTPHHLMFKFSDGAGPDIYLKFSFGTGSASATPAIQVQVGTGTNGAGDMLGQNFSCTLSANPDAPLTSKPIKICCVQGSLSILFGEGSTNGLVYRFGLSLSRYANADGSWKPTGFMMLFALNQSFPVTEIYNFSFASGLTNFQAGNSPSNGMTCLMPYAKTSLSAGGYTTPMPVYGLDPYLVPMPGFVMLPLSDCALNSDVVLPVLGATPRTYRQFGIAALFSSAYGYCCLWE